MLEYDIDLDVDYESNAFHGTVEISGLDEPGPVTLDSQDLVIHSVRSEGNPISFDLDDHEHRLRASRPLASTAPVEIRFSGRVAEGLQTGFFVARLGRSKALTTQLQPESCRRLLPCVDRPDRKAIFRLRVTTRPDLVVISNMPAEVRPVSDGRSEWSFAPTPPMSSYLLYLGVGPFEETIDDDGPVRVIVAAPSGKSRLARRTAQVGRTALRGFTDYFDLPFALPKLHFVVVEDFWAGMENWGAITGSEDMYLVDETGSPEDRAYGDDVILHETAHQWFGDLVTLSSWEEMWLNESFATFAVPLVAEWTRFRSDPWTRFSILALAGDRIDALPSTHPVKPPSTPANELTANADEITYLKGARLIRMIQSFVGRDAFRDGISEYLRDHANGNATSDDLWDALEEESGLAVAQVLRPWIERPGHPKITVRQAGPDVELTQERFSLLPGGAMEAPWPIPLAWEQGSERGSTLFDRERMILPNRSLAGLRLDPGRTGFYRILWPPELRRGALGRLAGEYESDRFGWISDAALFLRSGDYSLEDFCDLLDSAASAEDRATVDGLARILDELHPVLADEPRFQDATRHFLRAQTERLGERPVPGEREGLEEAREFLFWVRVRADPEYARSIAPRFDADRDLPSAVHQAVTCAYAQTGGARAVENLLRKLPQVDEDGKIGLQLGLAETRDPEALLRAMNERLDEIPTVGLHVFLVPWGARNPVLREPLWRWIQGHLQDSETKGTGTPLPGIMVGRSVPYLGIGRSQEVRSFLEAAALREIRPRVARGLDLLAANERMRERLGLPNSG